MIARTWRGWTARSDTARYAEYVRQTGIRALRSTPGNRGAFLMYREDDEQTEFLVLSLWESLDHVRAFAGDDVGLAVFYPEDERYLTAREERVAHFTVDVSTAEAERRGAGCDDQWEPAWL